MKILLAVDGSEYTQRVLDYVKTHPTLFDVSHSFTLFNAQVPIPPHARSQLSPSVVDNFHRDEALKVLAPAESALRAQGLNTTAQWKVGPAGETVGRFAEDGKFDLIIMGTHGHGALARLVMGSVTTQVLAHCTVPVLLVR